MEQTELYSRQESLHITPPNRVAIIGAGGTGTWVGILLAMVGTKNFQLFDMDMLEESNRARLPYSEKDVGSPKNFLLARIIDSLRHGCVHYEIFGEANETSFRLLIPKPDYMFDCSDRRTTQRFILQWCKDNDVKYVRVGYDGSHITTDSTISAFETELLDEHGYRVTPSYAPTAILPAIFVVDGICRLGRIPKICTDVTQIIEASERL